MRLKSAYLSVLASTVLAAPAWISLSERGSAGQAYIVNEQFGGNLFRLEDLNGDGDALDVGEQLLWASGLTSLRGMESDGSRVYVVANDDRILRLTDVNGDGDALDIGEQTVWADGLYNPRDVARGANGDWFYSDFTNEQVWRLIDGNNDGDVLDIGERLLYADGLTGAQRVLLHDGSLLVSSNSLVPIRRLTDLNDDGDAFDVGESLPITPNLDLVFGLLDDGQGGFYANSVTTDTIYHAVDRNGDGDMLDVAEMLSYADGVITPLSGPEGMVPRSAGGFLVAANGGNQIMLVNDLNGDADALDIGELTEFATGISAPYDIVAIPTGLPGDYNDDGIVDAADYVMWRANEGTTNTLPNDPIGGVIGAAQYEQWRAHFGQMEGGGSGSALGPYSQDAVPEPRAILLLLAGAALPLRRRRHKELSHD